MPQAGHVLSARVVFAAHSVRVDQHQPNWAARLALCLPPKCRGETSVPGNCKATMGNVSVHRKIASPVKMLQA